MSSEVTTGENFLVLEPTLDLQGLQNPPQMVMRGPLTKTFYRYNADSVQANGLLFQNIVPPALTTITDPQLLITYELAVQCIFGTANPGNPCAATCGPNTSADVASQAQVAQVAPRALPLHAATSTLELKINGSSTSVPLNDFAGYIYPNTLTDTEMAGQLRTTPTFPDTRAVGTATAYAQNPLGTGILQTTDVPLRGSFVWTQQGATTNPNQGVYVATFSIKITEPLAVSPFSLVDEGRSEPGFAGVNNFSLQFTFDNVQHMICAQGGATGQPGSTLTSAQASIIGFPAATNYPAAYNCMTPYLTLCYNTPDNFTAAKIPPVLTYPYVQVQPFVRLVDSFNGQTQNRRTGSILSDTLRLPQVPRRIFVYLRPSKNFFQTSASNAQFYNDTMLRITNVAISFYNKSNLLAEMTEHDLWRMSARNGSTISWSEWQSSKGSLLILDTANDLGLDNAVAAGQKTYSNFQINVTYATDPWTNCNVNATVPYTLYTVPIQPGMAVLPSGEACAFMLSGPVPTEVVSLLTEGEPRVESHVAKAASLGGEHTALSGGSLLGKVGHVVKHAFHFVKHKGPALKRAGEAIADVFNGGATVAGGMRSNKHSRVV